MSKNIVDIKVHYVNNKRNIIDNAEYCYKNEL